MRARAVAGAVLGSLCALAAAGEGGLRILAPDGQPLAAARVQLWPPFGEGNAAAAMTPPSYRGETDQNGTVLVVAPARRGFLLLVNHPEHEPFSAELEPSFFANGLRLETGWTWAGRVEAEAPLSAEGKLCLRWSTALPRWQLTPEWERCAEIGRDGRFTLGGLSRVPMRATIDVPGFLRRELTIEPGSAPPELRVERGRMLRGRVVTGAASVPVMGATVRAAGSAPVQSGAGGDFEIALAELGREITLEAAGFRSTRLPGTEAEGGGPLLVRLSSSQRVELVLTTPRGASFAKPWARVELLGERGRRRSWGAALAGGEKGRYHLDLPEPGRYRLEISAPGWLGARVPSFSLAESELRDLGAVALERGASFAARLVDARTNQAVTGAEVSYAKAGLGVLQALARQEAPRTISDREGAFVLAGLPPGRAILTVDHPAYAKRRLAIVLQANEEHREPPIWLDSGVVLTGRVAVVVGRPAEGLGVSLFRLDLGDLEPEVETTTGAEGSFAFPKLSPATYRVVVGGKQPLLAQDLELTPGVNRQTVELEPPAVPLTGRLLREGHAVASGTVALRPRLDPGRETGKVVVQMEGRRQAKLVLGTGVGTYSAEIDEAGRFSFGSLPPGLYELSTNRDPAARWSVDLPGVGQEELEIELVRPLVSGRLVDAETTAGIEGVVEVIAPSGIVLARASSGGDGWFEIAAPVSRELRLSLSASGYQTRVQPWQSSGDGGSWLLSLDRRGAGELRARVLDETGEPVPSVMITVAKEHGGMTASLMADSEGEKHFQDLPAGEYRVVVADSALGVTVSPRLSIGEGADPEIELALEAGSFVEISCPSWSCASKAVDRLEVRREDGFDLTPYLAGLVPGLRMSAGGTLALGILGAGGYTVHAVVAGRTVSARFVVSGPEPTAASLR